MGGTLERSAGKTDAAFALLLRLCAEAAPHGSPQAAFGTAAPVEGGERFLLLAGRRHVHGLVHSALREAIGRKAGAQARHTLAMAAATVRHLFERAGMDAVFPALGRRACGALVEHGKDIGFPVSPDAVAPPACGGGKAAAEAMGWTADRQHAPEVPMPRRRYFLHPLPRRPLGGRLRRKGTAG